MSDKAYIKTGIILLVVNVILSVLFMLLMMRVILVI